VRILFYNLGYGRGHDGSLRSYLLHAYRFVYSPRRQQRAVLDRVVELIERERPDVFAGAEVVTGSFRNAYFDQHRYLIDHLTGRPVAEAAVSKYGETVLNLAPFHVGNCNNILAFQSATIREHYLTKSRKKLVFRVELATVTIFAVHLPLISSDRHAQLLELATLVNETSGDVVVCGDFNIFDGTDELAILREQTDLVVAGTGEPTFPSAAPRLQLDVFLYRINGFADPPRVRVLEHRVSDHRPIVLDWESPA